MLHPYFAPPPPKKKKIPTTALIVDCLLFQTQYRYLYELAESYLTADREVTAFYVDSLQEVVWHDKL